MASVKAHPRPLQSALINDALRRQDRKAVYMGTSVNSLPSAFGALKACIMSRDIESCRHLLRTSAWESQLGRPGESEGGG